MEHKDSLENQEDKICVTECDESFCSDGQPPKLPKEITEAVVRFYSPMVYRIALTRTQSQTDAEDIFQEVFLKLLSNEKDFETEEHRKAWIIKVTINCCNSHFVAPWKKNVTSMDDVMLSQIAGATEDLESRAEKEDIYGQVLKLPKDMRDVVLLFYYEDMSIREISHILQTSEVNVKKRLSRARQKLRLELEEERNTPL